jgi:hypothetical protein
MSPDLEGMLNKATSLLFIGVMAFLLYQVVEAGAELIIRRHRTDTTDNIRARAIHTQGDGAEESGGRGDWSLRSGIHADGV